MLRGEIMITRIFCKHFKNGGYCKNENVKNVKITAVEDNHSFSKSREILVQIIIDWLKSFKSE